jgi:LysR family glycine cleavage system transcriptional activator
MQYSRLGTVDPASVDVGINWGQPSDFPDFVTLPFVEGAYFPFASTDYLKRVGYKDLGDLPRLILLHDQGRSGWRAWLQRAAAMDCEFDPALAETGTVYPHVHLTLGACLAGEGVALLTRDPLQFHLRAKFLTCLSGIGSQEDKSYLVLTPKFRPLPRGALIFAHWLQSLPGAIKLGVPRDS